MMRKLKFTYWKAQEGGYEGYLNDYPDFWTQGETMDELKQMLVSLHEDVEEGIPGVAVKLEGELELESVCSSVI